MKNLCLFSLLICLSLPVEASTDFYDQFQGGGIAYAPSLVVYGKNEFNFPGMNIPYDFTGNLYFHGLQGWGDINDRWRIGAALLAGDGEQSESSGGLVKYASFSQVSGFLFLEFIMPVSYSSQFTLNLSGGISTIAVEYFESTPTRDWLTLFVGPLTATKLTARQIPTLMPQISFLYQFSRRAGLRINGGALFYVVDNSQWKVNNRVSISNANNGELLKVTAPMVQAMIYFGM
jgi:hypothetical protein